MWKGQVPGAWINNQKNVWGGFRSIINTIDNQQVFTWIWLSIESRHTCASHTMDTIINTQLTLMVGEWPHHKKLYNEMTSISLTILIIMKHSLAGVTTCRSQAFAQLLLSAINHVFPTNFANLTNFLLIYFHGSHELPISSYIRAEGLSSYQICKFAGTWCS